MLNPELEIYKRRLPHWRLAERVYFITWRLHKNQYSLNPEERDLIFSALKYFDGERYKLYTYVVMDDHIHVLFHQENDFTVSKIVHSWKSYTGHELVKKYKRTSPVWQDEYFDRIMRSEAEFYEKAAYILYNPHKRWPNIENYKWVAFSEC
jgi:REP element-mobilizing transposase RayT